MTLIEFVWMFLIPFCVDALVLGKLLKIDKKQQFVFAVFVANALLYIIDKLISTPLWERLRIIVENYSFNSIFIYFGLVIVVRVFFAVIVKTPIYWKMISKNSLKALALSVLASGIVSTIVQLVLSMGLTLFTGIK